MRFVLLIQAFVCEVSCKYATAGSTLSLLRVSPSRFRESTIVKSVGQIRQAQCYLVVQCSISWLDHASAAAQHKSQRHTRIMYISVTCMRATALVAQADAAKSRHVEPQLVKPCSEHEVAIFSSASAQTSPVSGISCANSVPHAHASSKQAVLLDAVLLCFSRKYMCRQ